MKRLNDNDSVILNNYHKAIQYYHEHKRRILTERMFWLFIIILSLSVDYALSYAFFESIYRNELGVIPADLIWPVRFKACLGLSVVILLKYTIQILPKVMQKVVFIGVFILLPFVIINIGKAQIYPPLYKFVQSEYKTDNNARSAFREWMGTAQGQNQQTNTISPEEKSIETAFGKYAFLIHAKWYSMAFLCFSLAGAVAMINLSITNKKAGKLSIAKHVISRYNDLEHLEEQIQKYENDKISLNNSRGMLYRAAKEEVLSAYSCGIRKLKTQLNKLIIFGEKHRAFSIYSIWQIRRQRNIYAMNIEDTKRLIREAEDSLHNIRLGSDVVDIGFDQDNIELGSGN